MIYIQNLKNIEKTQFRIKYIVLNYILESNKNE